MTPRQATLGTLAAAAAGKLVKRVDREVDDALAHALKAVTDTVRDAPDGRATFARINRSPSYAAALGHLSSLSADLAPLVADAREDFYRAAFAYWSAALPAELLRGTDPQPTVVRVAQFRATPQQHRTIPNTIGAAVSARARALKPALNLAGARAVRRADGTDVVRTWARSSKRTLAAILQAVLSGSATLADNWAQRDVIDPDYLSTNPHIPDAP